MIPEFEAAEAAVDGATAAPTATTLISSDAPAGVVFAVSWRGPVLPDLNALLGGYFKAFQEDLAQGASARQRVAQGVTAECPPPEQVGNDDGDDERDVLSRAHQGDGVEHV